MNRWIIAVSVLVGLAVPRADWAQSDADQGKQSNRDSSLGGSCAQSDPIPIVPTEGMKRPGVKRNYIAVIYDARSGHVFWYDYASQQKGAANVVRIANNSAFVPVTFSKERILVRVCGVKFNSTVTITPTSTQVPENTLDIRGVPAPSSASSPGIQAPSAAGGAAGAVAAAAVAPTAGTLSPANVEKTAQQAATYYLNFEALRRSILAIECETPDHLENCAIDTVPRIRREAENLSQDLDHADYENQGLFNGLFLKTQGLVTDLNNLSATLTAANLLGILSQLDTAYANLNTSLSIQRIGDVLTAVDANNVTNGDKINDRLGIYLGPGYQHVDITHILHDMPPSLLLSQVNDLSLQLDALHSSASAAFSKINDLHDHSRTAVTSILTPITNGDITVQISVQDNYVPFGFANAPAAVGSATGAAGGLTPTQPPVVASAAKPSSQNPQPTSPSAPAGPASPAGTQQHVDAQVQIEVHHKADFNAVAGFAVVAIRQRSFGLTPSGTGFVPFQSQNQQFSVQPFVGLNWYPGGRDFYPGYLGNKRWIPGILFGTSFTSTSSFMGGPNFELVNGLDLYGGIAVGTETHLAKGVTLGTTQFPSASATVPTTQSLKPGAFFGVGFDLSVFSAIFKSH